jgi:hypothetical protein
MHCALIVEDETITRSVLARVVSTIPAGSQALRELVARLDARARLEALSAKLDPPNVIRDWQVAVADAIMLDPDAIATELAQRATSPSPRTSFSIR